MNAIWQEHQQKGMQAFMNGYSDEAISHWKNAVCVAEERAAIPSAELADVYYCLGKTLADLRQDDEAARYLRVGVTMLTEFMPGDQKLKVAQYALGEVLNRTGGGEEADMQFKQAYDLPKHVCFEPIKLKDAIKILQKHKLCKDLKGGVLTSLCHKLDIDPNGDNEEIVRLLLAYYTEEHTGEKRLLEDKFFLSDYTDFETEEALAFLNGISGEEDLLVLEDQKGDTADGGMVIVTMRRSDGEECVRACQSICGIVDEYNDALWVAGKSGRFCSLSYNGYFAAFYMNIDLQNKIHETRALQFEEVYSED